MPTQPHATAHLGARDVGVKIDTVMKGVNLAFAGDAGKKGGVENAKAVKYREP